MALYIQESPSNLMGCKSWWVYSRSFIL